MSYFFFLHFKDVNETRCFQDFPHGFNHACEPNPRPVFFLVLSAVYDIVVLESIASPHEFRTVL